MLEPARIAGGDFHGCVPIDKDRVFVMVGDVSGTGPASTRFMSAAKSALEARALAGGEAGAMLTAAERVLSGQNPDQLFVTVFAAILDLATGELAFANAGHEPPYVRAPGASPRRLAPSGGPPLCVLEGFDYPTARHRVLPGEWLCVVTDGATEAMNRRREFLGAERLRAALAELPEDVQPGAIIAGVRAAVERFEDGAERADDLTLLALRWRGPGAAL